ncbi:MAG: methyltransferase [Sedimentisphaerales bacterium]
MNDKVTMLNDLSWGYRAARVLHVANEIDLFTALSDKEMTLEEISQTCSTKPDMTEKLLIACTAMDLLEKRGPQYKNTELSNTYLVRGRELYQGDIIAHSGKVCNFWNSLEDEVRIKAGPEKKPEDEHRNFIMGMHNITVAGRADVFINNIDLAGRRKLFDLGGGPGTYSIAACRLYPQLQAVVFDLPETIAIAQEVIAREGMQDRVTTQAGDWETEAFGEDNDVVLLSNVLHGPGSKAEIKLNKTYDSMAGDGLLVVQDFLLNDEKTGPLIPALFNIMVGAYSNRELLSIIKETGFVNAAVVVSLQEIGFTWITAGKP